MKKTKFLALLLVLVLVLATVALVACKDNSSITLTPTELTLVVGKNSVIRAAVADSDATVTWSVDKADVLKIDPIKNNVKVTALKEGKAIVTATVGEDTATCTVTVTPDNSEKVSITLNGEAVTSVSLDVQESKTLVATASKGSPITWATSNDRVVTVKDGVITGVAKGTATVTAKVSETIYAEVAVTVNGEGAELIEMASNDEKYAIANPGTWIYNAQEWVTVSEAYCKGEEMATISFLNNQADDPTWFYTTQLFYQHPGIESGEVYKLSFKAEASDKATITINGNVVSLEKGEHSYTIWYTQSAGAASFSAQFGVNGKGMDLIDGTLTFKDLVWTKDSTTEKLAAPSFEYDAETGVITITDSNPKGSVASYALHFYNEAGEDKGSITVVSGQPIDLSTAPNGTWTAKLVAIHANVHYLDSDPSTKSITLTVSNDKTVLKNGGEGSAYADPGNWYEWHDHIGWNGSEVEVSEAYIKDGVIHFSFEIVSGSNRYDQAAHLYYHDSSKKAGDTYKLTMKLNSSVKCTIEVCGEKIELKEGDNDISVTFVHPAQSIPDWDPNPIGATIRMYFNDSGTFVISELKIEEGERIQLQTPSYTYDADTGVITISDPNEAGVGSYELGFFKGDQLAKTVVIKSGDVVDASVVTKGTYTLKVRAMAENAGYIDSAWSEGTATVESTNSNVPVSNGNEDAAVSAPDTWIEWHDQANWTGATVTMEECILDANGAIHLKYSATGSSWFAVQLFKKYSTCEAGKTYTVTLKIESSVAGKITVCGTVVELKVGSNDVEVTFTQAANKATLSVQFGADADKSMIAGGTFILSDIEVTGASQTQLEAPSFELDGDKKITITDTNKAGVGSYELGFFQGDQLIKAIAIKNGDTVDVSVVAAGSYTLKIRAIAEDVKYADSEWSDVMATVESKADKTDIDYSEEDKFTEGWRYWDSKVSADWSQWTAANCTEAYITADGKVTISFTIEGTGANWAMQLFYKVNDGAAAYNVSLKITATVSTSITVCGKPVVLTAGEAQVVTINNYKSGKGSALDIQFGLTGGTFTIEEVSVTEYVAPEYQLGEKHTTDSETIIRSGKADPQAQDNTWMLWWVGDASWNCGDPVTMQDGWDTYSDGIHFTYSGGSVNYCTQLFYKNTQLVDGTQYVLKCKITSTAAMTITVNGQQVNLEVGENEIEVLFTNGSVYAVDIQFNFTSENVTIGVSNVEWYDVV